MTYPDKTTRDACEALQATDFSEYEARCYCALVTNSPANGYQIAKLSGVPRAKVYESLERLVARGAAVQVESGDSKGQMFAAIEPEYLIDRFLEDATDAADRAREALARLEHSGDTVEIIWRITSRDDLIDRGRRMVADAAKTLHLALWAEEFDAILPDLLAAADRGVRIGMILYSEHDGIAELQQRGAGAILHSRTKFQSIAVLGKQFAIVQDLQCCIVGSLFPNESFEGVYTVNRGMIINAVDQVNHEIYLERILQDVGEPVRRAYGDDLENLDAFDPPTSLKPQSDKD